ncbi:hypothetical protein ACFWWB_37950 [Streptomyces sp. NPDC058690]|uniref:hypothetical protein n=1 Tax=Streptomyces sp. NPDC058690 TaxID=3346600 RepID=UPI003666631F
MRAASIVVHAISLTGLRVVTINDELVGLVADDHELIEALRQAGIFDAEHLLDDPRWVEWRGGRAHHYEAA